MASKRKKTNYKCKLPPFVRVDCLSVQEVKQNASWAITAFDLPNTWKKAQGEGVVVAVLDTGCQIDHEDLKNNMLEGYNAIDPKKLPLDKLGHGTHVAGIIAAEDNDIGIVGVAPKAKIRPVKILGDDGTGNMLNVAAGIRWAADMKCDFISMSLGSPIPVQHVRKAIQYAMSKGTIVFCAAGNAASESRVTKEIFYPANYPETIAIGAVDINMRRAKFSNTGKNLDFMAPGCDIISTVPDNWYAKMSGTSMAQPFACGVAALLLSYKRKYNLGFKLETNQDYVDFFKRYSSPVVNGNYDDPQFYQGFGIIDPRKFFASFKM